MIIFSMKMVIWDYMLFSDTAMLLIETFTQVSRTNARCCCSTACVMPLEMKEVGVLLLRVRIELNKHRGQLILDPREMYMTC